MTTMLRPACMTSRQSPSGTASRRHSSAHSLTASARIVRRNLRVYVDPHRLGIGVVVHRLEAHLAPITGVADAAERRAGIDALVAVDPDHARAHRICDSVRALQIRGPQPAAEAVLGGVRDL